MKRDLKLNISELEEVYNGIYTAKSALEEIADASERFQTIIKEQDSEAYEELSGLWEEKVQKEEADLAGKLECMAEMVSGYIRDMTAYVAPENESVLMRVDRNDIWWNYTQIAGRSTDFFDIVADAGSSWKNYKKFYMYNPFISAAENAVRKAEMEEEERIEREKRERNYKMLEEFRETLSRKMQGELQEAVTGIRRIYEENVIPFENMDDTYKKQIAEEYDNWATMGDRVEDVLLVVDDIGKGLWDGMTDVVTGIEGLLEGAVKLAEWVGRKVIGLSVPESLDEDVNKIFDGAKAILSDPGNALEAIGQNVFDVADEKGMAYSVSYVTADVVAGILLDKGIGKLKELRKAKKLNKVDDVLNAGDDVINVTDDLTGAGNHGTSVIEDVVENGKKHFKKFRNSIEANEWATINFKEWLSSLSDAELEALKYYTGNDYWKINKYLRYGVDTGVDTEIIENIRSALSKAVVPEDITVYRGTDLNAIQRYLQYDEIGNINYNAMKGTVIMDEGFMSTSIIKDSAFKDVVSWEIEVPAGTHAGYLENITQVSGEYEVLFNSGQKLLITDVLVEENNITLILEAF